MKLCEFSDERFWYGNIFKSLIPVNMNYVEGFAQGEVVYTRDEAMEHFHNQEASTHLPYIYLSAGVSAKLFQQTLEFAASSGAKFNGVLCGRAARTGLYKRFIEGGEEEARKWLRTTGFQNIDELNKVLEKTATTWKHKLS